ncbi:hypothetical protein F2P56_007760 [Juglans regia]|uniref:Uncharacterized protein n=1 Tax=Juglans regia TaxID=51240 RepID=A0A834D4N9_JUGRE|nr:hypothetical protein F2P56_007760 [Juglans regia]
MPLPYPVIRVRLVLKPDANVVVADGDGLAGIGSEGIYHAAVDDPDDFVFEFVFFIGELSQQATLFVVNVVIFGEISGIKEEVLEGLGVELVGRRADLEATHQGLEDKVVEISGVGEGAHGFWLWFSEKESL